MGLDITYRLNPFMNQVYFYRVKDDRDQRLQICGLNPFMNQVYFYLSPLVQDMPRLLKVLIPL